MKRILWRFDRHDFDRCDSNRSIREGRAGSFETGAEWQDALLESDVAALEKIYSDGLVYVCSSAFTEGKATYIAKIKSGASVLITQTR